MGSVCVLRHRKDSFKDTHVLKKIQKMDSKGFHMALNCVEIFGFLFDWKGIFVLIIPFLIEVTQIVRFTIRFGIKGV